MNSAQVRAKTRMAMKRREEEIEQEEIEGGELNLIPYLDIVTNLMLFLLARSSAGLILGQINTTLPDHAPADAGRAGRSGQEPRRAAAPARRVDHQAGHDPVVDLRLEGTLEAPKARIAAPARATRPTRRRATTTPRSTTRSTRSRPGAGSGKLRDHDTYEIILQCDPDIPYETVVDIMDAVRGACRRPGRPEAAADQPMPQGAEAGTAQKARREVDPDRAVRSGQALPLPGHPVRQVELRLR